MQLSSSISRALKTHMLYTNCEIAHFMNLTKTLSNPRNGNPGPQTFIVTNPVKIPYILFYFPSNTTQNTSIS